MITTKYGTRWNIPYCHTLRCCHNEAAYMTLPNLFTAICVKPWVEIQTFRPKLSLLKAYLFKKSHRGPDGLQLWYLIDDRGRHAVLWESEIRDGFKVISSPYDTCFGI